MPCLHRWPCCQRWEKYWNHVIGQCLTDWSTRGRGTSHWSVLYLQQWSNRSQMGQIRDLIRSYFRTCWPGETNCQMYWNLIWKSPGFVLFVSNLTHFGSNLDITTEVRIKVRSLVKCFHHWIVSWRNMKFGVWD